MAESLKQKTFKGMGWTTAAKGISLRFMGTEEAHPENMCCFTGTVFGMYGTAKEQGNTADFYLYRQTEPNHF